MCNLHSTEGTLGLEKWVTRFGKVFPMTTRTDIEMMQCVPERHGKPYCEITQE